MAQITWTSRAFRARPEHSFAKLLASALLAILLTPLLANPAWGPDLGARAISTETRATLVRSGDDVIITGSIGRLFETGSFAGPNRAEKTNRARITPDVMTVARGFDVARARMAALRNPAAIQPVEGGMLPALAGAAAQRVALAGAGPDLANPALGAINEATGDTPFPMSLSEQLAYARSDTPATDFSILKDKTGKVVTEKDIWCMATAIYFEARGESYRGQVAVGQVVMNRVAHRLYPSNICGVVFQNQNMRNACQFSFACDGIPETVTDKTAWAQANEIAKGVINGSLYLTEVANATHYHATYVYPAWAPRLKRMTKIGMHVFYRFKHA